MSKGQRAIPIAKLFPEPEQGKKNTSLKNNEVASSYGGQARTVLTLLPAVADEVLDLLGVRIHAGQLVIDFHEGHVQKCEIRNVHQPKANPDRAGVRA